MSGDVQPRKRKDKRKKKDEINVDEPRGTAAALGEGDVFLHSQHDHGTGGHWCAKIIFFSLLAVLVTLIGLIILENRGLTELEANSVESRYSGVLDGWIEDAPDDHHDEQTLDLKHHDDNGDDREDQSNELEEEFDESNHSAEDDQKEDGTHSDEDDTEKTSEEINNVDDEENESEEQDIDELDEGVNEHEQSYDSNENDDDSENEDLQSADDDYQSTEQKYNYQWVEQKEEESQSIEELDANNQSIEQNDEDESFEQNDDVSKQDDQNGQTDEYEDKHDSAEYPEEESDEEDDHLEDNVQEDSEVEVERIEREVSDEEIQQELSSNEVNAPVQKSEEKIVGGKPEDEVEDSVEDDEDEFLEPEDIEESPVVEHITAPAGKPLPELEDDISTEKPINSLTEEDEYEKQQEQLRLEKEQASHKDGGDSLDDDWPGEPSESYWRQQLDQAEQDLRQGEWSAALGRVSAPSLQTSARARYVKARALDATAEARRDNRLLSQAIAAYIDLLKMNERLSDKKLIEVTDRTLERIKFRGTYLSAEPVYKLLIRRFPDNPNYRNNLTVSLLMANRADLAETVLKETLKRWPNDHVALAHLGFILKTSYNRLEEAVDAFKKALEDQTGPANEPRFYYHYGDALLLLGRFNEAHEVHKRGAALGHFLSPNQRSLYNVERLKSKPWWNVENTPYTKLARALERSWRQILEEGESLRALYEKEKEGLKERGEWSQLDLFARGSEIPGRCKKAPVTCSIVRQEVAAVGCRRGQIKFSAMEAGTHVRPHVGPTNCRLRMHLGLSNTKDTYIRVDKETRQWQTGKVLLFDDSFEHEVWHNGTGTRLVLIVDVWHPDLTPTERRQLPAI
ncbi:aspartyl/asparaginyl beta-hydroxylase isoform X4 [Bombyx mandarina]|uniref:Aspartyl/asparaginyl beta-hydroxylase isoform X4 n=1 Tax=Bombyx mandarina TaxID=7092 RepID=A0A6J2JZF7_BOMMA|nr:aspartyl/asparaginyl beta-hydroxylase isoform X4 [Bombyx mandarina]